jgi:hypothetical protein
MIIIIDWGMLVQSCITASVVGAVTGITNWLLNRQILRRLEKLEESRTKKKNGEKE